MNIKDSLKTIKGELLEGVTLVAVSKTKPAEAVLEAYEAGQRIFGENKVQELVEKYDGLPKDIEWHLIGHLQTNKVKFIAPFVSLIHAVDSIKLLQEIDKQAKKNNRTINCLLQMHIAQEDTKFGLTKEELDQLLGSAVFDGLKNIKIVGLMGMATFTADETQIKTEFLYLKSIFDGLMPTKSYNVAINTLSMGMSNDYKLAMACGSTMIRLGSSIFGTR